MSISKHFDELPELTEGEALDLICALRYKHRFAGIILPPQDIRDQMTEYHFPEDARREPTDAEVDGVLASWEWNHLADVLTDHAWAAVNDAIFDALNPDA